LSEYASEERSNHSANTMELEDIHAFIDLDPPVHVLAQRADGSREETNKSSDPKGDVTGSWCYTDKPSNCTWASTDNRELALVTDVLDRDPAQNTERSSSVRVEGSEHGANGAVERTTTVEAEPAEPNQNSADEDERRVVGLSVDLVTLGQTLAEDEGIRKCRPSGRDVDRTAASKIERRKIEEPAVRLKNVSVDTSVGADLASLTFQVQHAIGQ
jgi:hypothetical protein